jgi:aminopeptidase N
MTVYLYNRFSIFLEEDYISNSLSAVEIYDDIETENLEKYNPKYQRDLDVLLYKINLELFPDEKEISGDVTIRAKVLDKSINKIVLNLYDNMNIREIKVNKFNVNYIQRERTLEISPNFSLEDTIDVRVIYSGSPQKKGFGSFNFDTASGKPFIYTLNEPVYASTWFPCVDLPDDKALAEINVKADSTLTTVSNGKLINVKKEGNKTIYEWKTVYPISTYLITFITGNLKSFGEKYYSSAGDSLQLSYFALPNNLDNAKKDFADHKKYLKVFEELFGPYPFLKEKYGVAEILWKYGAMENQTITSIGSNFISGRKFFSDMLIHELAHHWWGNSVGPKTWKDIWLNEGFATYSEALYWEKESGISALVSTMRSKKGDFHSGTLYNPQISLFSSTIYNKGAWVLHMLRREMGSEMFFEFLKGYYKTFAYKNADTYDLKKMAEKISGKKLDYFFDQWVFKGEGIIDIEFSWRLENTGKSFSSQLFIDQVQNGYDIYKFPVDIKFIFEDGTESLEQVRVDSRKSSFIFGLNKKPVEVILDPDMWLLAKINISN